MNTEQRDIQMEMPEQRNKQNPGATLRLQREQQGLSTAATAATLRLPEKILLHLEAGRFDQLPGDTFARGYVRNYANLLGLDANRLVLEYDSYVGAATHERSVNGIDKVTPPGKTGHMLVTWSSVIIALIILASVLVWWYDSRPVQVPAEDLSSEDRLIDEVKVDALALPVSMEQDLQSQAAVAASANAALFGDQLDGVAEPVQNTGMLAEGEQPAAASAGALQMSFNGNCWLQITAVGGQVLRSSLMQAGQSLSIDHAGPVDVVIGAVETLAQFVYRGQPVDMQSYSQAGVVRLRLGQ